jgi:anti-sigma B factor antagonist
MLSGNFRIDAAPGSHSGQKILAISGPLTIHTLFQFHEAVRAEAQPAVILDFTAVPHMDSAGLGALVSAHVAAQKAGRQLVLAGANKHVVALLEMTHVEQLFHRYPSVSEAETALAAAR